MLSGMSNLKTHSAQETDAFFQSGPSLVFCGQNEFARFGANTEKQYGGTGGMESCSAAFLWNPNTHESYVFHTHVGTNWPEVKNIFTKLCKEGQWEITAGSGKDYGAWQKIEEIAGQLSEETGGRIISKQTAHAYPNKEEYKGMPFEEQRGVPHCSYMLDSSTGEVTAFHEETLEKYWDDKGFTHIFGDNPLNEFANAYQYIARKGTVPVCSFDGKKFTNPRPEPDGTPEMAAALHLLEATFVAAIIVQAGSRLEEVRNISNPEQRAEAIEQQLYRNNAMMDATKQAVIKAVLNPESNILNPERASAANGFGREMYAKSIWHGMYFGDFQGYVEKALACTEKGIHLPPEKCTTAVVPTLPVIKKTDLLIPPR